MLEREEIYSRLWGYTMVRGDRSVDVFVRKLRQKLEKASPQWRYIHTHFGIGYRFAAESLEVVRPEDVPSRYLPRGPPERTAPAGTRWPSAIRASSRGRSSTVSSPPAALQAHRRDAPLLEVDAPAGEFAHDLGEVGLVADDQQAPVGGQRRDRLARRRRVEAAGQRLVGARPVARLRDPEPSSASSAVSRARALGL